jgi:hypothetical protein
MLISMVLFLNELFYSSIYPSAHVPGAIQIPISGNNTGSLPDLTNVNFSSPIRVPLDQDLDQGSSPYSSSPVNTSPATLSPTSIPQGVRQGPFHFAPVSHAHSNHLSVPRYPNHPRENVPIDSKNITGLVDGSDFTQLTSLQGIYQQCPPTSPSPTVKIFGLDSVEPEFNIGVIFSYHKRPVTEVRGPVHSRRQV